MTFECFKATVSADYHRYADELSFGGFMRTYIVYPGFRVTFWYRIARFIKLSGKAKMIGKLATLWLLRQQLKTGVTLNPGTEIGPGLYIPHHGCIVVSPSCRIGKNLYLSHDVLIGKVHAGKRKGVPVIGDDAYIGAGARLLGSLQVGDNAAIAANSVVLNDVPASAFVAGAPAIIKGNVGASNILGIESDENS